MQKTERSGGKKGYYITEITKPPCANQLRNCKKNKCLGKSVRPGSWVTHVILNVMLCTK